ncbi:transferase [Streptomyces sp. MMS24-I29]|uniref:transferase n=1 Tax=Streptomyces sp. MMS24-I29 TaxID=3351480 RepID=UPI003C7BDBAA
MTVPAERTTLAAERRAPRADCVAGPDGSITFELDVPAPGSDGPGGQDGLAGQDGPGSAHHGPGSGRDDGEAPELLLRLRGGRGDGAALRLPLTPVGEGRFRAVLPSTVEPAEGRWDVHVRRPGAGDDVETAVEPGIRDLRLLMDRVPEGGRVAVRIPYPTVDGRLALHCWIRSPHAEAGPVTFEGNGMTVEGTLYGAALGDGAHVEARWTGAPDQVCRVPAGGSDGAFAFTLPFGRLVDGPVRGERLWSLWLVPGTGAGERAGAVRISRLLDDVWDRKNVFVYPGRDIGEGVRATACYTGDNDLCVRVGPGPGA